MVREPNGGISHASMAVTVELVTLACGRRRAVEIGPPAPTADKRALVTESRSTHPSLIGGKARAATVPVRPTTPGPTTSY